MVPVFVHVPDVAALPAEGMPTTTPMVKAANTSVRPANLNMFWKIMGPPADGWNTDRIRVVMTVLMGESSIDW
jgi:hypothetical protein